MLVDDEPITIQPPGAGTPSLRGVGTQHPEVPRGPLLKMRGLGLCKAPWGMGTQALRAACARGLWGPGPGRGSARENVVGLLPLKQRNRLSLPADRLLPEAGGMEGPVLSFSLPVSAVGENSCFEGRRGCGQDVPGKQEASILLSARLLRAEGPGAHLLSRPFLSLEEGCWTRS